MTPRRPRRVELAQDVGPERLRLRRPDAHAEHLTPAVGVDADGDDHRDRDDAAGLPHLHVGRVDPQVRPVALQRPLQERLDPAVDLLAPPGDLALGDAGHPHRLDQVVDRPRRDTLDVRLLNDGGERLLRHPTRLEEARKVAALAQLRDAQLDGAGAGLPAAVAVAVAMHPPVRAPLAKRGASQPLDLQLHQAMGGKANHLAQEIGVRAVLKLRPQAHHGVGHRSVLGSGRGCDDPTL